MPAWMEKIKDTFTAKADLKSLFIVLQPDNQVSTVMVVSYVPTDKDSFQVFMDLTARIAMDQKTIPDNLLLHFEGIPCGRNPSAWGTSAHYGDCAGWHAQPYQDFLCGF
jgi:hypothetical protein